MAADAEILFSPFTLGDLRLPNRIVMAPLTRSRARKGALAPTALNAEYYRQRASAGFIVSEASQISQEGQGYLDTPGVYADAQVEGWRKVTDAVHGEGGLIFIQLWHVGRISNVSLQPSGAAPVSSSAIAAKAQVYDETGFVPTSTPRALETSEIARVVEDYRRAAENARKAGFDGVEIHAANGYLLDQFLRDGVNRRDDEFGGSVENRLRFPLQVVDAVLDVWDRARVGVRVSPVSPFNDIADSAPESVFVPFAEALGARGLAYLHAIEGATGGPRDAAPFDFQKLRKSFSGAYVANNGFTRELAIETLEAGRADLIAFGRPFISNPDLVERLREDAPLNAPDPDTFYGGDAEGYTDYPALSDA
ncbi:alkene reductase [Methylocella sp.]|uniref:alkene reductase n=1 Tax=Methylocella sp. TaxID=1978226 RepID=UPI0035B4D7FF